VTIPRTLVIAGHFPPRVGGVETFTHELLHHLPPDRLLVVASAQPQAREADAGLPFPVVRRRRPLLLADLRSLVREHACEVAWIPAAAPFGICAPLLRAAGIGRVVASTHGQELGWLRLPGARATVRAITRSVDVLTYLGSWSREPLAALVDRDDALQQLAGGVDARVFKPPTRRPRASSPPTVISASRLVRRKGHDALLRAWPEVLRRVPDARLVIVGDGPMRARLERSAGRREVASSVLLAGQVSSGELVRLLGAADVFAAPCRDVMGGLAAEGLGLAVLEASAVGLPVVVGRSGGSREAVVDGRTGLLVTAGDRAALAGGIADLLLDPVRARDMGRRGREWVRENWTWSRSSSRLAAMLGGSGTRARD